MHNTTIYITLYNYIHSLIGMHIQVATFRSPYCMNTSPANLPSGSHQQQIFGNPTNTGSSFLRLRGYTPCFLDKLRNLQIDLNNFQLDCSNWKSYSKHVLHIFWPLGACPLRSSTSTCRAREPNDQILGLEMTWRQSNFHPGFRHTIVNPAVWKYHMIGYVICVNNISHV
jgi:hypothetical protein